MLKLSNHNLKQRKISSQTSFLTMSQHRRIKKRSLTSLEASRGANNPSYGKWKPEEEAFAARLISAFNKGELTDCVEGTSLRSYLAKRLNCIPMRISKKFAGLQIGKVNGTNLTIHLFAQKFLFFRVYTLQMVGLQRHPETLNTFNQQD